jgi:hypothetical protein
MTSEQRFFHYDFQKTRSGVICSGNDFDYRVLTVRFNLTNSYKNIDLSCVNTIISLDNPANQPLTWPRIAVVCPVLSHLG